MKLLVLGDSGTVGQFTGGQSFTQVFFDRLTAESDEPVEMEHAGFVATGERAPAIARKHIERHQPDLLMVVVGPYVFTAGFVWLRVRRLLGDRVGRWFRGLEQGFDSATRASGRWRSRMNSVVRGTARRVIGTDTITTREESTEAFSETLRGIAQEEGMRVMVVAHPYLKGYLKTERQIEDRWTYMADARTAAERHHFLFLEGTDAFPPDATFEAAAPTDRLHGTRDIQKTLGEFVYKAYGDYLASPESGG